MVVTIHRAVGGMSLLDASLAISGHEVSEEEFLTKYISHPDEVADCRIGWVDWWRVVVWFRNSEEMWVVQEKWSALGTIPSYVDTVPHRGVFIHSCSWNSEDLLVFHSIMYSFCNISDFFYYFHFIYTDGYVADLSIM